MLKILESAIYPRASIRLYEFRDPTGQLYPHYKVCVYHHKRLMAEYVTLTKELAASKFFQACTVLQTHLDETIKQTILTIKGDVFYQGTEAEILAAK